jgi:hypothetical protein
MALSGLASSAVVLLAASYVAAPAVNCGKPDGPARWG